MRAEDAALGPVRDAVDIIHPVVHPLPAPYEARPGSDAPEADIPMNSFLLHHVHEGQINALVVSSNGTRAYSGGQDGAVVVSEMIAAEPTGLADAAHLIRTASLLRGDKPILALALSPDESQLAVAQFSTVSIFDLKRRMLVARMTRVKGRILSLAWDPRGELVALGRANGDVHVWVVAGDRAYAGENTTNALERYEAGSSPIIRLAFHPSGRAFFSAERAGGVMLWRLLRTEKELGLRDDAARVDRSGRGMTALTVPGVTGAVEDMWLDRVNEELYVSTSDGLVHHWKVRGLKKLEPIQVGTAAQLNVQGIALERQGAETLRLLATSGRGQRIQFWCPSPPPESVRPVLPRADVVVVPTEPVVEERSVIDPDLLAELEQAEAETPLPPAEPQVPGLVARTEIFRSPLELLRTGGNGPHLWAAEKTGNLLSFNASSLLQSPIWLARAQHCTKQRPAY
ncbi:MAG: hypothetical protein KDD69_02035 [Bdellovibrionales bacterium]|nr:hypothetical protein [Bdellovibrionales bacterium]